MRARDDPANLEPGGSEMRRSTVAMAAISACMIALFGCAGTASTKYQADDQQTVNQPVKDPKCYDASVMLGVNEARARDIARKVLAALDSSIESETGGEIRAQRNRHFGVMVGSGGEELRITLTPVDAQRTFMTATTKTGFVGGAGQKPWSCQIVDEAAKLAGS
jgi:hypothetical protein